MLREERIGAPTSWIEDPRSEVMKGPEEVAAMLRLELLGCCRSSTSTPISGTYRQSVQLVSGNYALMERSREFTLVPWRPVIKKQLGRQVSGLVRADGISCEFVRKREPSIGM